MNFDCSRVRPLLDSYLTNELQVETLHAVNQHLQSCAGCRVALQSRERTRAALQATVRGLLPGDELTALVRDSVRAEAARRVGVRWLWMAVAVAAALTLVLALGWKEFRAEQAQILARLGLGKGDHIFCARGGFFPDDLPTPAVMREQVGAEYAPLVDQVIARAKGYVIRDGHLCHWQEREFVHFILERENKLISLVIVRKHSPDEVFPRQALLSTMRMEGHPVYTNADNGMAIAGLDTGRHLAFTVSERGPAEGLTLLAALTPSLPR